VTASELLADLRARGVVVEARGDRLRLDAPAGVLTDELRDVVRAHKPRLLALLAPPPARPVGAPVWPFDEQGCCTSPTPCRVVEVWTHRGEPWARTDQPFNYPARRLRIAGGDQPAPEVFAPVTSAVDAEMAARPCVFCGRPGGWWRCEACVEKALAEKYGPDWRAVVDGDEPAA